MIPELRSARECLRDSVGGAFYSHANSNAF
jgi:hypothetical protein